MRPTACVQWEKAGKYGGGQFPTGVSGTTKGWGSVFTRFTFPVDADPGSLTVGVYVRGPAGGKDPTPTGVAYFDNVSLVPHALPVLGTVLLSPVYRGRVTATDTSPIVARRRIRVESPTSVNIHASLQPKAGGRALAEKDLGPFSVRCAASGLCFGHVWPFFGHFRSF